MKNKMGLIWFILGIIPYVITLIYSIISIFAGVSTCFLNSDYNFCDRIYGLNAFGQVWYMCLYIFFPVFLIGLLFIVLGLFKSRSSITRNIMILLFGATPFILSLLCFLSGCLTNTVYSVSVLFSDIFVKHFFIVFSDFIGIIFILIGLRNIREDDLKNKKKDK